MNRNRSITTLLFIILMISITMIAKPVLASSSDRRSEMSTGIDYWDAWVINPTESTWTEEELGLVHKALFNTVTALDDAGFDGQALLKGYRFRRQPGEFVGGVDGRIALVRHHNQEIILSDTAFLRLQGYYIYHELGHVVDKRLDRKLSQNFHNSIGSIGINGMQKTADGYWLNEHAKLDQEEATADAFALWVILRYTENYRPVFWNTPYIISYENIVSALDNAIQQNTYQ